MGHLTQHIHSYMELVFFVYGTAFAALGLVIFSQPRKDSGFALAGLLPLLGWFAITHGLNEYIDMWVLIEAPESRLFFLVKYAMLVGSFLFLFEFGRRMFRLPGDKCPAWKNKAAKLLTWHMLPAAALLTAAGGAASSDFFRTSSILSRYLLGFPGAVLTGLGIFSYYRCHETLFRPLKVRGYFILAGSAFLAYGALGGLIVPGADFFPASLVSHESFLAVFGVPVQVFRTLCAVAIAYAMTGALKIFNWEVEDKIRDAFAVNSPDCIANIEPSGNIISMNPAGLRLHGLSEASEAAGLPADLNVTENWLRLQEAVREAAEGRTASVEYKIAAGGGEAWLAAVISPVFGMDGTVKKVLCVSRDVTGQRAAQEKLRRNYDQQVIFAGLLRMGTENIPMERILDSALERLLTVTWLNVEPKGAIFLADGGAGKLVMKAKRGLDEAIERACAEVPFGRCMCGRAASDGEILHAAGVDERHDISFKGMGPHGHYCVPIKSDGKVLGVFTLYLKAGHKRDEADTDFLAAAADLMSGIIVRKTAEVRALAEKKRAQNYLDIAGVMLVALDREGRVTLINRKGVEVIGYPQEEVLGRSWFDLVIPQDQRAQVKKVFAQLINEEAAWQEYYENLVVSHSGELRDIAWHNQLLRDAEGRITGTLSSGEDITASKRAEEETRKLSEALRQTQDSVIITDPAGIVTYVNPAFEKHSGYRADEIQGQSVNILGSGEHPPEYYRNMWGTLKAGKAWEGRFTNKRKDGSLIEMSAVISPIKDPAGNTISYASLQRDMTAENAMQEQLRQSQKLEAVGMLASGVAHDFNNLLGAIDGYAKFIADGTPAGSQAAGDAEEIRKAVQRAAALTRQLLIFSRKKAFQPKIMDLNATAGSIKKMLARLIGDKILFEMRLDDDLRTVRADPSHMEQVLMNLAVNARDAMPGGGDLTITTGNISVTDQRPAQLQDLKPGEYVVLKVSDTGCGMTGETISKIFEPFFTTKGPGKGTGLGLSTVFGIVKQSGGEITVESEPGKGSTFSVYLPAAAGQAAAAEAGTMEEAPAKLAGTVMLVDDDNAIRTVSHRALIAAGLTVIDFGSSEEALNFSKDYSGKIDVLLTDVVLPGMDGFQLAREMAGTRPGIEVFYMSGYADQGAWKDEIEKAGERFLQKPVDYGRLVRELAKILRRA